MCVGAWLIFCDAFWSLAQCSRSASLSSGRPGWRSPNGGSNEVLDPKETPCLASPRRARKLGRRSGRRLQRFGRQAGSGQPRRRRGLPGWRRPQTHRRLLRVRLGRHGRLGRHRDHQPGGGPGRTARQHQLRSAQGHAFRRLRRVASRLRNRLRLRRRRPLRGPRDGASVPRRRRGERHHWHARMGRRGVVRLRPVRQGRGSPRRRGLDHARGADRR